MVKLLNTAATNLVFASSGDLDVEEADFRRNERANEAAVLLALEKNLDEQEQLQLLRRLTTKANNLEF